jgi:hypothetical protein
LPRLFPAAAWPASVAHRGAPSTALAYRHAVAQRDRRFDRHPDASVESLIPSLSCTRCSPHPPFARLIGLAEHPGALIGRSRAAIGESADAFAACLRGPEGHEGVT